MRNNLRLRYLRDCFSCKSARNRHRVIGTWVSVGHAFSVVLAAP
jgi:hypothetical protein